MSHTHAHTPGNSIKHTHASARLGASIHTLRQYPSASTPSHVMFLMQPCLFHHSARTHEAERRDHVGAADKAKTVSALPLYQDCGEYSCSRYPFHRVRVRVWPWHLGCKPRAQHGWLPLDHRHVTPRSTRAQEHKSTRAQESPGRSVDAGHLETVTLVDVYIKCLQHPLRTPLLCPISASSRRQSKRVRSCHFRAIDSLARILNL